MTMTPARPTRRTLVRGAAWSVPVIAVAAAAPAFATSLASATLTSAGDPIKWGTGNGKLSKHVSWDLVLTNGQTDVIVKVVLQFTYRRANGEPYEGAVFVIYDFDTTSPTTWTGITTTGAGGTATATRQANIPPGSVVNIHTDFNGEDNSMGDVVAKATITYEDGTERIVSTSIIDTTQATGPDEPAPHSDH